MMRWFRAVVVDAFRGMLSLSVSFGVGLGLCALFAGVGVGFELLMGHPSEALLTGVISTIVSIPSGVFAWGLGALLLYRKIPDRHRKILRAVSAVRGLRVALDWDRFVAVGSCGGRALRLEFLPFRPFGVILGYRIHLAVRCEAGHPVSLLGGGHSVSAAERAWMEKLSGSAAVSAALALLVHAAASGRGVHVLPKQIYAIGSLDWLDGEAALAERIDALLVLASAIEQIPPPSSEVGWSHRSLASVLPNPGAPTPMLDVLSVVQRLSHWGLALLFGSTLCGSVALVVVVALF